MSGAVYEIGLQGAKGCRKKETKMGTGIGCRNITNETAVGCKSLEESSMLYRV